MGAYSTIWTRLSFIGKSNGKRGGRLEPGRGRGEILLGGGKGKVREGKGKGRGEILLGEGKGRNIVKGREILNRERKGKRKGKNLSYVLNV